jgi:hypothetical protein
MRWQAFQAGANMVTHCGHALAEALQKVSQQQQQQQQQQQEGADQAAAAPQKPQQQQQQPVGTSSDAGAAAAAADCECDWCGLPGLSPAEYWMHQQLYHINHENKPGTCQICGK